MNISSIEKNNNQNEKFVIDPRLYLNWQEKESEKLTIPISVESKE